MTFSINWVWSCWNYLNYEFWCSYCFFYLFYTRIVCGKYLFHQNIGARDNGISLSFGCQKVQKNHLCGMVPLNLVSSVFVHCRRPLFFAILLVCSQNCRLNYISVLSRRRPSSGVVRWRWPTFKLPFLDAGKYIA